MWSSNGQARLLRMPGPGMGVDADRGTMSKRGGERVSCNRSCPPTTPTRRNAMQSPDTPTCRLRPKPLGRAATAAFLTSHTGEGGEGRQLFSRFSLAPALAFVGLVVSSPSLVRVPRRRPHGRGVPTAASQAKSKYRTGVVLLSPPLLARGERLRGDVSGPLRRVNLSQTNNLVHVGQLSCRPRVAAHAPPRYCT